LLRLAMFSPIGIPAMRIAPAHIDVPPRGAPRTIYVRGSFHRAVGPTKKPQLLICPRRIKLLLHFPQTE